MFYSAITPNILFDLLTAVGYIALGLLVVLVIGGIIVASILKIGLLALASTEYPSAERISLEELEDMFTSDEPTAEQRARAHHPAGRNITSR